jgi:RNA polymerase sigma-70 factor (ECF subfamily)
MIIIHKAKKYGEAGDPELIRRAQRHDVDAFAELYRRHRSAVLRLADSRLRDFHVAEEIVQETFARAFVAIKRFDPARPLAPWLATIATNLVIDVQRRWGRLIPTDHADRVVHHLGRDETVERVLAMEGVRRVRRALQELPSRQRRILLANVLEDMSTAQIAALERTSEAGVSSAVYRAREGVRRGLRRLAAILGIARAARLRTQRELDRIAAKTRGVELLETGMASSMPMFTAALGMIVALGIGAIGSGATPAMASPAKSQVATRAPATSASSGVAPATLKSAGPRVPVAQPPLSATTKIGKTRPRTALPSDVDADFEVNLLGGFIKGGPKNVGYGCGPDDTPMVPLESSPIQDVC